MSAPKSVTRIKNGNVEYTSNVDAAQYYIYELNRAALRDVGKFIKAKFRESFYNFFDRQTGNAGKATSYVVLANKDTKYPRLEIGLKKSQLKGVYGYEQEFGTSTVPRLGLLQGAVEENTAKIIEIESQYLSGLEDEATALSMIDEKEYDDED